MKDLPREIVADRRREDPDKFEEDGLEDEAGTISAISGVNP
jgi:hypothetical protein